ncbi:uncharacterized protein EMH_0021310 [Eimeria mitis]|uniref:Uncharacterized protein n=1 Tax=Eimeria mitis TaxID=44415 RepID=U6K9J6_9EIME|nr:uncharacterized protein EMH_0021310 [Eimeria mitis]CDJ34629.1 hypothetical protein EMH_0021310 [Eimeria mitis]
MPAGKVFQLRVAAQSVLEQCGGRCHVAHHLQGSSLGKGQQSNGGLQHHKREAKGDPSCLVWFVAQPADASPQCVWAKHEDNIVYFMVPDSGTCTNITNMILNRDPHSRPSTSKADEPDVSFIVRFPLSPTYPNGFLSHAGVLPVARGGRRQVQDVMEAIVPVRMSERKSRMFDASCMQAYGEEGIKTESVHKAYFVIVMDSRIGVPAPWSSTAFPFVRRIEVFSC